MLYKDGKREVEVHMWPAYSFMPHEKRASYSFLKSQFPLFTRFSKIWESVPALQILNGFKTISGSLYINFSACVFFP